MWQSLSTITTTVVGHSATLIGAMQAVPALNAAARIIARPSISHTLVVTVKVMAPIAATVALGYSAVYLARQTEYGEAMYSACAETTGIIISETKKLIRYRAAQYLSTHNLARHDSDFIRQIFNKTPLTKPQLQKVHSHPQATQARTSARYFMKNVIHNSGYTEYVIQPRPCEAGLDSSMSYFWPRDGRLLPKNSAIRPRHFITATDVDYYLEPHEMLCQGQPFMAFGLSPVEPGVSNEGGSGVSYTIINNVIHATVVGGASYEHQFYDYSGDSVSSGLHLSLSWYKIFGRSMRLPTLTVHYYACEQRTVTTNQKVTLFAPMLTYRGVSAVIARLTYSMSTLKRAKVDIGNWNVIRSIGKKTDRISICKQGNFNSASLTIPEYEKIVNHQDTSTIGLAPSSIKMLLPNIDPDVVALLACYVKETLPPTQSIFKNFQTTTGAISFTLHSNEYDEDAKKPVVSFMSPILDGFAYVPVINNTNTNASVHERLIDLQKPEIQLNQSQIALMNAFVDRIIIPEDRHTLVPVSEEAVYEKQDRPCQRQILNRAMNQQQPESVPFQSVSLKKEAGLKTAPARLITTEKPSHKLEYTCYVYALANYIKEKYTSDQGNDWFAFGRTPRSISRRVTEICHGRKFIDAMDYTKMDANHSYPLRQMVYLIFLRAFQESEHGDIYSILTEKRYVRTSLRTETQKIEYEIFFNSGDSQGSGLPDTSLSNSLVNAFIVFVGFYYQYGDIDLAWQALIRSAIIGGDDSVVAELEAEHSERACREYNHIPKHTIIEHGDIGVNFLARYYSPEVWSGSPNSVCDITRTMGKFHLTGNMPSTYSPMKKLEEKLNSLFVNDTNTPLVRIVHQHWARLKGKVIAQAMLDKRCAAHSVQGDPYPNTGTDFAFTIWPGLQEWESRLEDQLSKFTNLEQFLTIIPVHNEPLKHPDVPLTIEVDGVVVHNLPANTEDRVYPQTEYHDSMPKLERPAQDLSEDAYNNPKSTQAPGIIPAKVVPGKALVSRLTPTAKIPDANEFAVHSTKRQVPDKMVSQIAKQNPQAGTKQQQQKGKTSAAPKNDVIHVERKTQEVPKTATQQVKADKTKSQPVITKQPDVASKQPKPVAPLKAQTVPLSTAPILAPPKVEQLPQPNPVKPLSKRALKRQNKALRANVAIVTPTLASSGEKPPYTEEDYDDDVADWRPPRATKYVPKAQSCTPDATGDGRQPL